MLLQFCVANHLCFAEEQTLSLVASADTSHPAHMVELRPGYKHRALRAAALYGANAHGKTKLVEAMAFAQEFIVKGRRPDQPIGTKPFRLDAELLEAPSRFEFVIFHEGVEYTYGFVVDNNQVLEEWLFARPNKQERRYFERVTTDNGEVKVDAGPLLRGKKTDEKQYLAFVARGTRANQLFLTEAMERNVQKIKPIYHWFSKVLTVSSADGRIRPIEIMAVKDKTFIDFMETFLSLADTGISTIHTQTQSFDFSKIDDSEFREELQEEISNKKIFVAMSNKGDSFAICLDENKKPIIVKLKTCHEDSSGRIQEFEVSEESSGTQRLMHILPILSDIQSTDGVYVIDELDRKLHPRLSKLFVQTFLEKGKGSNAQFIFTTHETHLLDLDFVRRDEIWFVEKNQQGKSHLYSLAEFKIRPDLRIEKGYLQGRFGAIPFIGDTSSLGW